MNNYIQIEFDGIEENEEYLTCPYDPKHKILKHKFKNHLKVCNTLSNEKKLEKEEWFIKDFNKAKQDKKYILPNDEELNKLYDIKTEMISPEELKVPSYVKKDVLQRNRIPYIQTTDLEGVISQLDILYMTRVQRERFFNEEDYLRLKDSYILTPQKLLSAKDDLCIMHPLPRVNEISVAIDDDPRACYFKQVANGKYMRMALILKLLKEAGTI